MTDAPWSRAALRVWADGSSVGEIARRIGIPSADDSTKFWYVEPGGDGPRHLDDRLKLVKGFMAGNREVLKSLAATAPIDLMVSWSPKDGQDGLVLEAELVALLAECGAYVAMDTYVESDSAEGL
ncbi:hypothetical protein ACQPZF_11160 [Actinosynnema sp. CS-041913]|uniref:hypothetical protein n=1 Tax=Actinosynnema sp. CS-041913 TaxID=3239917 RepID=UPI003D89D36E